VCIFYRKIVTEVENLLMLFGHFKETGVKREFHLKEIIGSGADTF